MQKPRKTTHVERSSWAMIAPQVIGFTLFSMLPLLYILRFSFFEANGVNQIFVGFENFIRVFTRDNIYWESLLNTFMFSFGKLIVEIPLALMLAIFINKKLRGTNFLTGVFFMPNVLSVAVVALTFSFIFASFNGIVNNALLSWGLIEFPINWLGEKGTAFFVIILTSIWQNVGVNMLLLYAGLQGIPNDVYESAEIDGASPFKKLISITLPMLMPVLKIVLMLAIVGSITMTDLVLVMTNGGPVNDTNVVMLYVFQKFFGSGDGASQEMGYASALGVVTAVVLWVIVAIYKKITNKIDQMS